MISRRHMLALTGSAIGVSACGTLASEPADTIHLDAHSSQFWDLIERDAPLELLGTGYGWSEGPTWDRDRNCLYFSDVPGNTAYRWSRGTGVQVFLQPSGSANTEGFREPGANGLWLSRSGDLIICNHGERRIERRDFNTGVRTPLATEYGGKRFNSPNDVVEGPDGQFFFTDPPYGLEGLDNSPLKEQAANGVYRLSADGQVERLLDDMTFPNGVALSPDSATLYVSQSDPNAPLLREVGLDADGNVRSDRILFDATPYMSEETPGLPDGLAVTAEGHIFLAGPGGVLVLDDEGGVLGRILTGRASANCAFGEDGSTLFITAHDRLFRIRSKALGLQWT